jgi:exonuclease VII small subunit
VSAQSNANAERHFAARRAGDARREGVPAGWTRCPIPSPNDLRSNAVARDDGSVVESKANDGKTVAGSSDISRSAKAEGAQDLPYCDRLPTMRGSLPGMEVSLEQVVAQVSEAVKQIAEVKTELGHAEQRLKAHVDEAKNDLKHQAQVYKDELKEEGRKAAEGYGGTLERIERDLADLNKTVATKFRDHDLVLSDHNKRITRPSKSR